MSLFPGAALPVMTKKHLSQPKGRCWQLCPAFLATAPPPGILAPEETQGRFASAHVSEPWSLSPALSHPRTCAEQTHTFISQCIRLPADMEKLPVTKFQVNDKGKQ